MKAEIITHENKVPWDKTVVIMNLVYAFEYLHLLKERSSYEVSLIAVKADATASFAFVISSGLFCSPCSCSRF